MKTLSAQEFEQQYGSGFGTQPQQQGGALSQAWDATKNSAKGAFDYQQEGFKGLFTNPDLNAQNVRDANTGGGPIAGLAEAAGQVGKTVFNKAASAGRVLGGSVGMVAAPLMAATSAIGTPIGNKLGGMVPDKQAMQFEDTLRAHPEILEYADNALALSNLAGGKAADTVGSKVTGLASDAKSAVGSKVDAVTSKVAPGTKVAKDIVQDIRPTSQSYINHQVSKALDLTPGDLSNIQGATGNSVGKWMADNNLIGTNKPTTQALINDFYKTNYAAVRSEIAKVKTSYKPSQVPRYTDALLQLQKKVEGTPGLEKTAVQIDNLLTKKGGITLSDIQVVKELMDEHYSLYKVTGDVSEGVAKQGLANLRSDLKSFIEKQVKAETGADIKAMNNNVQTARSLDDAITTRDPKGLTRSNLNRGDIPLMAFAYFNPVVGIPAFFLKKVYETPAMRLRIARAFDKWSDKKKAAMKAEMLQGTVPQELKDAAAGKTETRLNTTGQRGFVKNPFSSPGEEEILRALNNYDAVPPTVNGKPLIGNPNADFRLSQLQEKLARKALSAAEIKEAATLLKKKGAI